MPNIDSKNKNKHLKNGLNFYHNDLNNEVNLYKPNICVSTKVYDKFLLKI